MKLIVIFAIIACAFAAEEQKKETETQVEQNKDKRDIQDQVGVPHYVYRPVRKQERITPVEESQEEDKIPTASKRVATEEYRPGQVFSLNTQELLDLQPERKAPSPSSIHLQQLFNNEQPEHRQNLEQLQQMYNTPLTEKEMQQYYFYEPQVSRQVSIQPSHAVIARPTSFNGGEASVGAALSVSDTASSSESNNYDDELLSLLSHTPAKQEEQQVYTPAPQLQQVSQNVVPQYQQVDRYITKPTKKPTKLRTKQQINPPQLPAAPQQYLIETTNVPNVPQPQMKPQPVPQFRYIQQQRQPVRYVSIPAPAPQYYEENQGLKVVAPPKLQPQRGQFAYRYLPQPQYQQEHQAQPKQYRVIEQRPQQARIDQRLPASSIDRPVAYIKAYPEQEKMRSVKFYDQVDIPAQRQPQYVGEQYYLRPLYKPVEQQPRYEVQQVANLDYAEPSKPPHSAIYVNKNIVPKKPQPQYVQQVEIPQQRVDQNRVEQVRIEQHGQSIEAQRAQLPPPKNNKAYTPQEFAALVAAGFSVTPIPVSALGTPQFAQSRSSAEHVPVPAPVKRRPLSGRRHQYLPLRSDEAP